MAFSPSTLGSLASGVFTYQTADDVTVAGYFSAGSHCFRVGDLILVSTPAGVPVGWVGVTALTPRSPSVAGSVTVALKLSKPAWVLAGAYADFDFVNDRYYGGLMTSPDVTAASDIIQNSNYTQSYVPLSTGQMSFRNSSTLRRSDLGLFVEQGYTQTLLWNRDLTNAAWTKSNVTAAKTVTGADNVANSASSITATAANGTILQALTLASSQNVVGAWIKRITGTGTLEMTMNGGTTWVSVTSQLVGGFNGFARVSIPVQTVTNPSVGFRIGTSGDAFGIDFVVQRPDNFMPNTAMDVTSAVVGFWADEARFVTGRPNGIVEGLAGARVGVYLELSGIGNGTTADTGAGMASDGQFDISGLFSGASGAPASFMSISTANSAVPGFGNINKVAAYNGPNAGGTLIGMNGGTVATGSSNAYAANITHFVLGTNGAKQGLSEGTIRRFALFRTLTAPQIQTLTT